MIYKLITFTILSFILIACNQSNKGDETNVSDDSAAVVFDTTKPVTIPVENEKELFQMEYKFTKGESFKYRMTIISQSDQSLETDTTVNQNVEQSLTYILDFKTKEIDEQGIAEIECTIKSVNVSASANGKEVSYLTGSKDSTERVKFAEYEALVNNPFFIRAKTNGVILEIFKADKISDKFLLLRSLTDSVNADEKLMIRDDMVSNIIKPIMAQVIREVPEHKVAKDSTWRYAKASIPVMIFKVDYQNIYKVSSLEMMNDEKLAVINGTVEAKVEGDTKYSENGVNYVFDKPISTASGKIYFNLNKGLVQKSNTQTRLENAFTMEMPTPQGMQKGNRREVVINRTILELM